MSQLIQEALRRQQVERHKRFISRKLRNGIIGTWLSQVLWAQMVLWALPSLHVGLFHMWLLLEAAGSLICFAVALGMMIAVRDTRD